MIFYIEKEKQDGLKKALSGLREMSFEMDNAGASIIHIDKDFS